mmetsp:Transcript_36561/g.43678  ORF Transcript_36561/g.43678 Transcript_36561/m.43678 type:complete len:108 (+) Transcript_36561:75-398(+)|eukprot:CAMPEP_0198260138 /NCGR_PEP_ID=MMETSP1447-20131203/9183_1 /TAXON_ID=420782 /ORGANISM="Chaetoceros dichaeta, Strain CCMP1751" /LENGTH=107 /DNA_ID=CAMNT_0043947725 /DNA_START=71 /DNA_END=394 /DNA_ORIENTATION=-
MTDMYDEKKVTAVNLRPYQHAERPIRGRAPDPAKHILAAEQRARERQIAYETVRILRKDVIKCYREEGVNHYEKCKEPAERYYKVVIQNDNGQVHPDWADKSKHEGW